MTEELKNRRERHMKVMQKNLKGLRQIAGYSINEFADELGVSKQSVSNWERGLVDISFPTYVAARIILESTAINDNNRVLYMAINKIFTGICEEDYDEDYYAINVRMIGVLTEEGASKDTIDMVVASVLGELPEKVEDEIQLKWRDEVFKN